MDPCEAIRPAGAVLPIDLPSGVETAKTAYPRSCATQRRVRDPRADRAFATGSRSATAASKRLTRARGSLAPQDRFLAPPPRAAHRATECRIPAACSGLWPPRRRKSVPAPCAQCSRTFWAHQRVLASRNRGRKRGGDGGGGGGGAFDESTRYPCAGRAEGFKIHFAPPHPAPTSCAPTSRGQADHHLVGQPHFTQGRHHGARTPHTPISGTHVRRWWTPHRHHPSRPN